MKILLFVLQLNHYKLTTITASKYLKSTHGYREELTNAYSEWHSYFTGRTGWGGEDPRGLTLLLTNLTLNSCRGPGAGPVPQACPSQGSSRLGLRFRPEEALPLVRCALLRRPTIQKPSLCAQADVAVLQPALRMQGLLLPPPPTRPIARQPPVQPPMNGHNT